MLGQYKAEPGEKTNVKENNKHIAKGKEKGCNKILCKGKFFFLLLAKTSYRIALINIISEYPQHDTSQQLKWRLVCFHKVYYHTHAKTGKYGIYDIGQGSTQTGYQSMQSPFVQGPLHA